MKKFTDLLKKHYQWIFSGIGVLIVTLEINPIINKIDELSEERKAKAEQDESVKEAIDFLPEIVQGSIIDTVESYENA